MRFNHVWLRRAYLKDWPGPAPGERPSAYIVMLVDLSITENWWCDDGHQGLGGCMLGAINREKLRSELKIPEKLRIRLVLALGKPAEKCVLDDAEPGGSIRYWRDSDDVHHVPKRTLDELILK